MSEDNSGWAEMMKVFGSDVYYANHQIRFSYALLEERLEDAVDILNSLPRPINDAEKVLRGRVYNVGLKAIVNRFHKKNRLKEDMLEDLKPLGDYNSLADRIKEAVDAEKELGKYKEKLEDRTPDEVAEW